MIGLAPDNRARSLTVAALFLSRRHKRVMLILLASNQLTRGSVIAS